MIGILGGTFDPIHYGHLRPAQEAARVLGLETLRLIPCGQPPHRAAPTATATQRVAMARLACAEFPGFVVDDRELRRAGPSYTVDTLESLRADVGDTPLCLLLGSDAFGTLESWHEWDRLPELAHLVVLHRPGWTMPVRLPQWAQLRRVDTAAELRRLPAGRLLFLPVTPQDISGTQLRGAIARHEPVAAWLPATVSDYIRTHHLYMTSDS